MKNETYEVATIIRTADGNWGAYYWGQHAEQGGISFTRGNVFSESLQDVMSMVGRGLGDNVAQIDQLVADKSKWNKGIKDDSEI